LIVASGYLVTHDHVVPISKVQNTMDDKAYVSLSSSELEQYPEYRLTEYEVPASSLEQPSLKVATPYGLYGASEPTVPTVKQKIREGIAAEQVVIEQRMAVSNLDGKIGKVARVIVNGESDEITDLVVSRGIIFTEQLVIPISMIEDLHEEGLSMLGTDEVLEQLPRYTDMVKADT
jgi:hypothetical protein